MTETKSEAPPFEIRGVKWICWVVDEGQRFEWRAPGGRRAGRNAGGASCWAKRGSETVGTWYASLREAMEAVT